MSAPASSSLGDMEGIDAELLSLSRAPTDPASPPPQTPGEIGMYVLSRPLAAPEPTGPALEALRSDLHFCVAKGNLPDLAAALASLGPAAARAAVNAPLPSGETLLHVAGDVGCAGAVRALLAAGAAIEATEPGGGQTALHYAAALGRWEAAAALLAGGARAEAVDAEGCTPGQCAEAGCPLALAAALGVAPVAGA